MKNGSNGRCIHSSQRGCEFDLPDWRKFKGRCIRPWGGAPWPMALRLQFSPAKIITNLHFSHPNSHGAVTISRRCAAAEILPCRQPQAPDELFTSRIDSRIKMYAPQAQTAFAECCSSRLNVFSPYRLKVFHLMVNDLPENHAENNGNASQETKLALHTDPVCAQPLRHSHIITTHTTSQ